MSAMQSKVDSTMIQIRLLSRAQPPRQTAPASRNKRLPDNRGRREAPPCTVTAGETDGDCLQLGSASFNGHRLLCADMESRA